MEVDDVFLHFFFYDNNNSMDMSLYSVNVPQKEYLDLINDIVRMVTIQTSIQFLYFLNNPSQNEFFTSDFFLILIYIVLGICVYWLIIKKIVIFK
jgi:hypothetical protein